MTLPADLIFPLLALYALAMTIAWTLCRAAGHKP